MHLPKTKALRARRRSRMEPLEDRRLLATIGNNIAVGDELQNYRIAIAATAEYTAYFGGVSQAYQAISYFVDDLNELFESELSIHLDLVSGTNVVYTDPASDPFTNGDPVALLNESQTTLDAQVGNANYDVGHVFGTFSGGGSGIASLAAVGRTGVKARGSSSSSNPIGDGWLALAGHEISHQFGASHTFNGVAGNCTSGNRSSDNAYEPGSGTTLQSYGGICSSDNIFNGKDVYFHSNSFEQIQTYINRFSFSGPDSLTPTGNSIPTVDGGSDYTIPARSAFELTAVGTETDTAQTLTYHWEQLDLGPAQPLDAGDNGSSPLFRSYPADGDPSRSFPRYENLLVGTIPAGETLPTTDRELNFRVTVRDGAGGVNSDDVLIDVVDTGAAFEIISPNSAVNWTGGATHTVTWNVAGTNANGINSSNVDIRLSTDGGQTFPLLLETTANDGSASVNVPNLDTSQARLRVQGSDSIFFDINNANFTITANNNAAGVSFVESNGSTTVEEGGAYDSYQIALNTQPSSEVTIEIAADADTEVSLDGINFAATQIVTLSSTTPRTVTVRAVDDLLDEGTETSPIQHTIVQSGDASYPSSLPLNQVTVQVIDNELPPVIGLDFDCCGRSAPENWSQTTFFTDQFNLPRDDGQPTAIDLDFSAFGSFNTSTIGPNSSTIPQHGNSLSQLAGFTTNTGSVRATYNSLTPGAEYGVFVLGFEQRSGTYTQSVSISGETTLPSFTQSLVAGSLHVNDELGDSTRKLVSFEHVVAADANGRIVINLTPVGNSAGVGLAGLAIREVPVPPPVASATVIQRQLFYNNSVFDGNDPAANSSDANAIATDKQPLLPGSTATFANYTSDVAGVNGIMIDIAGLANPQGVDATDFNFHVGRTDTPANWRDAPTPTSVTVQTGAGTGGSDRVTLIWDDGLITNTWLEVSIPAGGNLGLSTSDVFYFGNAVGETGNSTSNAEVNGNDFIGVRANKHTLLNPAPINDRYDINRDRLVNAADLIAVRDNTTLAADALPLISPVESGNLAKAIDAVAASIATEAEVDLGAGEPLDESAQSLAQPAVETLESSRTRREIAWRGLLSEWNRRHDDHSADERFTAFREQMVDRFWARFDLGWQR